jgi:hypothetical protein
MTVTLTGDVFDALGIAHATGDRDGISVWLETYYPVQPDGDGVRVGRIVPVPVAATGEVNLSGIPATVGGAPLYRLIFDSPALRGIAGNSTGQQVTGVFELTESRTIGWCVANSVSPESLTTYDAALDARIAQAQAAAAAAQSAALNADADADRAETAADAAEAISGLTGEDTAVAYLVSTHGTDTHAALEGTYLPREVQQALATEIVRLLTLTPHETDVAPFEIVTKAFANGGGKPDNVGTWIGYNASRYTQQAGEDGEDGKITWHMGMESGYHNPDDGTYGPEWYLNYASPDGTTVPIATFRPIYVRLGEGDTNSTADKWAHVVVDIGPDPEGVFGITPGYVASGGNPIFMVRKDLIEMSTADTVVRGVLAVRPGAANAIFRVDGTSTSAIEMRVNGVYGGGLHTGDVNALEVRDKVGRPVLVFTYGNGTNTSISTFHSRLHARSLVQFGGDTGTPTATDMGNLGKTPTVSGNCVRGTVNIGTGAAPAAGDAVELTLPVAHLATPTIVVSAGNYATSVMVPYAYAVNGSTVRLGLGVTPDPDTAVGTYQINYTILG